MSVWQKTLEKMLQRLTLGEIKVTFPDGSSKLFKGSRKGPTTDVCFLTEKSIKDTILGGSLGFCEGVIDGKINSSSMSNLIEIGGYQESGLNTSGKGYYLFKLINKVFHLFNRNSIKRARKNISAHYDLGNDFYKLWLDETMTYSCGIFKDKNSSLKDASILFMHSCNCV